MDFFDLENELELNGSDKYLVLIIYDISDNKHRLKISKFLECYGFRVQKSSFEAMLTKKKYKEMLEKLEKLVRKSDNIRIYKLKGYGEVKVFGEKNYLMEDDMIVI